MPIFRALILFPLALVAALFAASCTTTAPRTPAPVAPTPVVSMQPQAKSAETPVTTSPQKIESPATVPVIDIAAEEPLVTPIALDSAPDTDDDNIALHLTGKPELPEIPADTSNLEPVVIATAPEVERRDDLWQRIRNGFKLNHDHKRVAGDIAWFQRNQEYLNRVVDRAEPYLYLIVDEVERRGIPMEIALLPIVESAFQPFAYSHGRAAGIWQFIPGTGRLYGMKQNWWYDGRRDVYAATHGALSYLQMLAEMFHGDYELALASYNSGEGNVMRAVQRNHRAKKRTDFWNLKLPAETRSYVPRLHAISAIVENPARYGITLRSIPNRPYLARVPVDGQIDLAFAAYLAEISLEEIYKLNPAFNRWATDPDGPHFLMLPVDKAEVFEQRIAQFPMEDRLRWERRRLNKGETVAAVAKAYGTTVDVLERVNKIKANKVRPGRDLIIPISMHSIDAVESDSEPPVVGEAEPEDTTPPVEKLYYTVRRGDTLYAIARKHHLGVKEIAQWNHMTLKDPLKIGQTLELWSQDTPVETSTPIAVAVSAPLAGPPQEDILRQVNYTVRRGDTLLRVAERFKVSIGQIQTWNRLPKDRRLRPGQKIKLQVDVTQQ